MKWISGSAASQRCSETRWLFECSELIVMFEKPVWDDLSFVTWCVIVLDVAIRRWSAVVIEGWRWSTMILRSAVASKRCSVGAQRSKDLLDVQDSAGQAMLFSCLLSNFGESVRVV